MTKETRGFNTSTLLIYCTSKDVLSSILYQGLLLTSYKSILSGAFQGVAEKDKYVSLILLININLCQFKMTDKIQPSYSTWGEEAQERMLKPTWVVASDTRRTPKRLPK